MALDNCATCGEEHEPPQGSKCKRTRLSRKPIKKESGDEALEVSVVMGSAGVLAVEEPEHEPHEDEDAEEQGLWLRLPALNRERRVKE